ncbi:MAG TPA: enoyl-CoA hydratase-related protein [Paenalcaligenes sp.]|nr:enoyl-CoA hydratase-related protein [Paenalcaligenes sp.]
MQAAQYNVHENVALITFNNPPVNGLSYALRAAISHYVAQANDDDSIDAIVITGSERAFSGGADVREFGTDLAFKEPILKNVIASIEDNPKPIVAAIDGVALGGGFELALGAHFRVARSGARVGLPEVNLGIIPGAGGTQRLPRVIGVEKALPMILEARLVPAHELADTELFAKVVDDNVVDAAINFAQGLKSSGLKARKVRDLPIQPENAQAILEEQYEWAQARYPHLPAKAQAVKAILDGVVLGFEQGLPNERSIFLELVQSSQSVALRYVFGAERTAARIPGLERDTPSRDVRCVGIYGSGELANALARDFNAAGLAVIQVTRAEQVAKELRGCELLIEANLGTEQQKEVALQTLDQIADGDTILATTSAQVLNHLKEQVQAPTSLVRLQPGPTIFQGHLWELGRTDETQPEVLATLLALARKAGTHPISGLPDSVGVGTRLLDVYLQAAHDLLRLGLSRSAIDTALTDFGFAVGPFETAQLLGLERLRTAILIQDAQVPTAADLGPLMMAALANEGARLLDEKVIGRTIEFDMIAVHGYGIGRFLGGPMHYTEHLGLKHCVELLNRYADILGSAQLAWQVTPRLQQCAADEGKWQ